MSADSVEFWLHPDFGCLEHSPFVWRLDNRQIGLNHDAAWKATGKFIYGDRFIIPPESNCRWDAECADTGQIADTKLAFPSKYGCCVYLSHREKLEQERRNCVYPVYRRVGTDTQLMCFFSFNTAMLHYAIRRFEEGRTVYCEETDREEAPWSINLRTLRNKPGVSWFLDLPTGP
jgi:hypothetical protein